MKIVFFSLLCLILIGITSYSYAQFYEIGQNPDIILPEVLLQLELRNSDGNLLAYMEESQIIGINPTELNRFMDNLNHTSKEFFIRDDQKYEIQQWETLGDKFVVYSAYSSTRLLDIYENELVTLLVMRHDSYQTQPGDTSKLFWTVIRPVS